MFAYSKASLIAYGCQAPPPPRVSDGCVHVCSRGEKVDSACSVVLTSVTVSQIGNLFIMID
jgi:hypothetical protein